MLLMQKLTLRWYTYILKNYSLSGNYLRPLNSLIELQIVESNIKSIMLKRDQLPDSPDELKLLRIM